MQKKQQNYCNVSVGEVEKLLSKYQYAEIRIEKGNESGIRIVDNEVKVTGGTYWGVSARVLENGAWGFSSSNSECKIKQLLESAKRLCRLQKGNIKAAESKIVKKKIKQKSKETPQEEQVKQLLDAKKHMKKKDIHSRRLSCSDGIIKKEFYNSEGSEIIQEMAYSYLGCSAIAKRGSNLERSVETSSSRKGFKGLELYKTAEQAAEKAERMLYAEPAKKGRFTVVLDPEMTGVFSHEAVGHASEADAIIEKESILADKQGKRIGNELVTIVDDPTAKYFGQYDYDDEGVKAKKAIMIKNGIVNDFLNSRETADRLDNRTNGHARAMDYQSTPIVRMSNTFFLQGESSKEDVFDIKDGVYVKGMKGGSVDTFSGGFMFKAEEAYEIKNGETGAVLKGVALSGNILDTMKSVVCVGKDFGTSPGICGKSGQEAPVEDGGPHIRVENMMLG